MQETVRRQPPLLAVPPVNVLHMWFAVFDEYGLDPHIPISRGGLARRETGRFPGGPLLQEVYQAPRWIMTSKIGTKIVVTRCISQLKICQKMRLRLGSTPDPAWGAYSASPDL